MDEFQQQRNKEQDALERKFLVIPFSVLADERLTPIDKLTYGRALFFDQFFEAPSRTAKILGCSENQIKISKRKLETLGLIKCISNDGRGKTYIATINFNQQGRVSKSDTQTIRKCPSENQNLTTENKTENKAENNSSKDKSFEEAHEPQDDSGKDPLKEDEQPKRYGNAEINEILDEWEDATGFSWHSTKQERFAAKNLIAKYGSEATRALVRRVKAARHSDDQFAPQIAKPSQLVGKYEKLTALTMWEERQQKAAKPKPSSSRPIIEGPKVPRGPVYERDFREDKTEEELRAECQSIREKFKGTKYEHLFNGGSK